jgi:hypothetical protein
MILAMTELNSVEVILLRLLIERAAECQNEERVAKIFEGIETVTGISACRDQVSCCRQQ